MIDLTGDVCLGVDVGGTFTDAVLTDGTGIWRAKSPTTPGDVGEVWSRAIELAAARAGSDLDVGAPCRAAVRSRHDRRDQRARLARRTAGRADHHEGLRRARVVRSRPPGARRRRLADAAAGDRLLVVASSASTSAWTATATSSVHSTRPRSSPPRAQLVEREQVEALAVSFLWSFRNPLHEQQAIAALAEALPHVPAVSGAALHPAIREFERTTFALLNAYTPGRLRRYRHARRRARRARACACRCSWCTPRGGSISVAEARRLPDRARRVGARRRCRRAAASVAQQLDVADLVTCDMGGTSFDVSVVEQRSTGAPQPRRAHGRVDGVVARRRRVHRRGRWLGRAGSTRAACCASVPGPRARNQDLPATAAAAAKPTVTDALVVLGYVDPTRFLGGDMALDADAATEACARVGEPLALDAQRSRRGASGSSHSPGWSRPCASRLAARGLDPRTHALFSYGGCGALFTPSIAAALGSPRVLIPELASVLSAFGAATADVRRERLKAVLCQFPVDPLLIEKEIAELREGVLDDLAADGIPERDRGVDFEADLRFKRQVWEIPIPLADGVVDDAAVTARRRVPDRVRPAIRPGIHRAEGARSSS